MEIRRCGRSRSIPRSCERSAEVDRIPLQKLERDDFQRCFMGCREPHLWSLACLKRLLPALGTETPAIAGLEAGKAEFGHRGGQIIAGRLREGEKIGIDPGADRMHPEILGSGIAA